MSLEVRDSWEARARRDWNYDRGPYLPPIRPSLESFIKEQLGGCGHLEEKTDGLLRFVADLSRELVTSGIIKPEVMAELICPYSDGQFVICDEKEPESDE